MSREEYIEKLKIERARADSRAWRAKDTAEHEYQTGFSQGIETALHLFGAKGSPETEAQRELAYYRSIYRNRHEDFGWRHNPFSHLTGQPDND